MRFRGAGLFAMLISSCVAQAQTMSLDDAIRRAVSSNPSVQEASANRRATDFELRQSQGALLPQIRLQADIGPERRQLFDFNAAGSEKYVNGRQISLAVRQLLFDGFATVNDTWRQAARVEASSWRVQERSELIALDTVQGYTDILRLRDMIGHADRNVAVHRQLFDEVEARFNGGRAGRGDRDLVLERVAAAEAARAELQQKLGEGIALFRRAVGAEPRNLTWPGRRTNLPKSREVALQMALSRNPTIRAAGADVEAAQHQREATRGGDYPTIALEGRATRGKDTLNNVGRFNDVSAKLSANWLLYSGGTDTARQSEAVERVGEQQMKMSALQRQAIESIDRAWTARIWLDQRAKALSTQVSAAARVVSAFRSEYQLGQRTLLDLLNAEQSLYNARIGLVNSRGLAIFADYQLLAAAGNLMTAIKVPAPPEAKSDYEEVRASGAFMPPIRLMPMAPAATQPLPSDRFVR
jgi:adhesin transport system outer membrane protein